MNYTFLQLGLAISVVCNCISLWRLMRALKDNDWLWIRVISLEMDVSRHQLVLNELQGVVDDSRIQGMAEDTEVAE